MGRFKMRLLLIATSLAVVAAAPHNEDRQKGRPAQGRDLSKFKPKLPEVAFRTAAPTSPRPKPFEFKKEARALQRSAAWKTQVGLKTGLLVAMKLHTTNGPGRLHFSLTTPGSAEAPSSQTSG